MISTMARIEVNDVVSGNFSVVICSSVPEELGQPNPLVLNIEHPQLDAHATSSFCLVGTFHFS